MRRYRRIEQQRLLLGGLVLAVLLLSAPPVLGKPPRKVKNKPYPTRFSKAVRKAVQEGIAYVRANFGRSFKEPCGDLEGEARELWERLRYEEAAGAVRVLRRAGADITDPVVAKAMKVLEHREPRCELEACHVLLALGMSPLPPGDPSTNPDRTDLHTARNPLTEAEKLLARSALALLLRRQTPDSQDSPRAGWGWTLWTLPLPNVPDTCLALLALEAAERVHFEVPVSAYTQALDLLLHAQARDGPSVSVLLNEVQGDRRHEWRTAASSRGFALVGGAALPPTGYYTAAGAVGILICRDALGRRKAISRARSQAVRVAVADALAWIQEHYDVEENPYPDSIVTADGSSHAIKASVDHYRWLQRLGELAGITRMRFIGTHDWYREGAELLMRSQEENGAWSRRYEANYRAILFLQRAKLRSPHPVITPRD